MRITPGRIVQYCLSAEDAEAINRRRTSGASIAERMVPGEGGERWPAGAQAHIGNPVEPGDVYPAMAIRVGGGEKAAVNLQVFLDGSDVYWATSRYEAKDYNGLPEVGCWRWPERE